MAEPRKKASTTKAKPQVRRKPLTGSANPENPSLYKTKYAELAGAMCRYGATDQDLAHEFGVARTTIRFWAIRHQEFAEALRVGKDEANARVERSLFMRATGYDIEIEKHVSTPDGPRKVREIQHIPPETTAACKWLFNRDPERWRPETARVEVTGGSSQDEELSAFETARRVAFLLGRGEHAARALQAKGELIEDAEVVTEAPASEPQGTPNTRQQQLLERGRALLAKRGNGND